MHQRITATGTTPRGPSHAPPTHPRWRHLVALCAALGILVSGCSIQIHSEPDPSIDDSTLLLAADHGSPMFARNFNPYLPNKRTAATYIYEPLIMVNPLNSQMTPWLAEEWDQPDPATITMTVREGVTWTDGEPMTAEDVAFTFDLLKQFPALDTKGAWTHIKSIDVEGRTVTFHLKGPDVPALYTIGETLIVPEHIWSGVTHPDTWPNPHPVGTGPFTLGNFSALRYTLDRNPHYWQQDPVQVEHVVLPAATQQLDVVTGGFDWAYSYMSDVETTWGGANEDNTHWFPPGGNIALLPNHDVEPFGNVDVRRGIALALNRETIANVATQGYMNPSSQTGLLLPNQKKLLDPHIPNRGILTQDRQAAIAAFAKAGFTYDDGTMYTPSGEPFTFTIMTANGYADWLRAVQEIKDELARIGIEISIDAPQAAAYQANLSSGKYEVAMGTMGGGNAYQAYNTLLSSTFYTPVGGSTQNNRIRFQSEEVDELLAAYRSAVDTGRQEAILHRLESKVYNLLPAIALYQGGLWGLYNNGRFTGWPTAENPYSSPQTWGSSPLLVLTRLEPVDEEESA